VSGIGEVFARCAAERRAAFIPFIMAGDPSLAATADQLAALAAGGADIIELGVPFSDPMADGPVNQRAATRALAAGTRLSAILELIARHRDQLGVPLVLYTYFNPLYARGLDRFAEQAATSGVDGILCVDLPPEEAAAEFIPALRERGVDTIFLLAPTSTRDRIARVAEVSSGFAYYVSRTGVTGERDALPPGLVRDVKRLRRRLDLPLAVGFGISSPDQVAALGEVADAVVVGSHLVRLVEQLGEDPSLPARLEQRVRELAAPLQPSFAGARAAR